MPEELIPLRNYAHIGDAVWELFVRDYVIFKTSNAKKMHEMTTDRVKASFQKEMLYFIEKFLTEEECQLAKRGRNLPIPIGRKSIQQDYRPATAFEVLLGYWYINQKERLSEIYSEIKKHDKFLE